MKVRFENLGPLREATVDLSKPLTVIVGGNGTGKTYLAYAIQALSDLRTSRERRLRVVRPLVAASIRTGANSIAMADFEAVWADLIAAWNQDVHESLAACFAAPESRFADTRVDISFDFGLMVATLKRRVVMFLDDRTISFAQNGAFAHFRSSVPSDETWEETVAKVLVSASTSGVPVAAFLTAERLGLQVVSRELAALRFERAQRSLGADTPPPNASYPWPILETIVASVRPPAVAPVDDLIAERISRELCGGRVIFDDPEATSFQPTGSPLLVPIQLAASSVKALVPLIAQLRIPHSLNDALVIDEPEMSLHPDHQSRFARIVGAMIAGGRRMIVATHSDYFVRELSHLTMLHDASPATQELARAHDYDLRDAIDPARVAVLRLGGGAATDVPVDRFGFRVDTIDDELRRLSVVYQDLQAALDDEGV